MTYKNRNCPICNETHKTGILFQKENIAAHKMSSFTYASRKNPEFMCHEMIRCKRCDLVYVANPPESLELAENYHNASYDSSSEAADAAETYSHNIGDILNKIGHDARIMEIGAGSGDFLSKLKKQGYKNLVGIGPSVSAIEEANNNIKNHLVHGVFNKNDFNGSSFDLVCCFMTLEHVYDPRVIADDVINLLKKGGYFVVVVHNYRSMINTALGRKSPIIDIEHMQLFSPSSINFLFSQAKYKDISAKSFTNTYSIIYWIRLIPLPNPIKKYLIRVLTFLRIGNLKVNINVGNIIVHGKK